MTIDWLIVDTKQWSKKVIWLECNEKWPNKWEKIGCVPEQLINNELSWKHD